MDAATKAALVTQLKDPSLRSSQLKATLVKQYWDAQQLQQTVLTALHQLLHFYKVNESLTGGSLGNGSSEFERCQSAFRHHGDTRHSGRRPTIHHTNYRSPSQLLGGLFAG